METPPDLPPTQQEDPWAFLTPWFEKLRGHVDICVDNGRSFNERRPRNNDRIFGQRNDSTSAQLGGDPTTCWLDVQWRRPQRGDDADITSGMQSLGEAVMLTCALGSVAYDVWVKQLTTVAALRVPTGVDISANDSMPRRIEFVASQVVAFDGSALAEIFLHDTFSGDFERDYLRFLHQCRASHAPVPTAAQLCIPVRLRFFQFYRALEQDNDGLEDRALRQLTMAIRELHTQTEAKRRRMERIDDDEQVRPFFALHSLDIDISEYPVCPDILQATQDLLAGCTIPIRSLSLPARRHGATAMDMAAFQTQWASLVLSIAGLGHATTTVDQLRLYPIHTEDSLLALPLFSALVNTPTIQAVHISTSDSEEYPDVRGQQNMLCWITYALLGQGATSSIQTLSLDMNTLSYEGVSAMESVVNDEDDRPDLVRLWEKITTQSAALSGVAIAPRTLPAGTLLTGYYGDDCQFSRVIRLHAPVNGMQVWVDTTRSVAHIFVPGYGFCSTTQLQPITDEAATTTVMATTTHDTPRASPSLSTLVVTLRGDVQQNCVLQMLLRLMGPTLRTLRLDAHRTNEQTIDAVFSQCPQLKTFFAKGVILHSMDPFIQGYKNGVPLTSLCLQATQLRTSLLIPFLELLGDPLSPVQMTLERLQLGRKWPFFETPRILRVLDRVLRVNHVLSYLEVPLPPSHGHERARITENCVQFNQRHGGVPLVRPQEQLKKYAFLSVLRRLGTTHDDLHVDSFIAQIILGFAMEPLRRSVNVYCTGTEYDGWA